MSAVRRAGSRGGVGGPRDGRLVALEAVLFDLDGTLIDSIELILASFRHATRTVLGRAVPDEWMLESVGLPLAQQLRELSDEHADELLRAYREHNLRVHDEMVRAFPGVAEALAQIAARGLKMGIVTSKMNSTARRGLGVFGIADFFDVVVGSDDVTIHKPDPHPLRVAAEALGVDVRRCAYVGDSPHDMAAACAAGCAAIGVTWGVASRQTLTEAGADYVIDGLGELPGLLGDGE